ncbi:MAG: hypothetical protein U1G07_03230 [Verrucomicrobiota bacterium]
MNAVRLGLGQWIAVAGMVVTTLVATPWIWRKIERFETGRDYRIPYSLSKDYWLYERRLRRLAPDDVLLLGDSVVWGEYVRPDGTLSHFLNQDRSSPDRFVNAGVNGLFPLALEGLVRNYATGLQPHKILLHCNLLWMTSPKADLSTPKEERFNHAGLVPQFSPRIPCYRADFSHRLAAVLERHFTFVQWADHLQITYFGQKNILSWTLEEEGDPPRYINAPKNPLAQITLAVPTEPSPDPDRGRDSPRHKPWSTTGQGATRFDWVDLDRSLQWGAFQRLVKLLQSRGNDVLVVLGPFNEHIMAEENRAAFRRLRDGVLEWLGKQEIRAVLPETLPSDLYADASHPLTEGYRLLAASLQKDPVFQEWLKKP